MSKKIAAAALLAWLLSTAVHADDCMPLTVVASVEIAPGSEGGIVIPANVGGQMAPMTIDTSAAISELTDDTVSALHLRTVPNQFGLYSISGSHDELGAAASPFGIGNIVAKSFVFRIGRRRSESAGMIGADILKNYDVDFDLGGGKLNFVSQDHCFGKVVHWQTGPVAVVPITVLPDGRFVMSVEIDGHPLNALLDTASPISRLVADAAHGQLGVSTDGLTHTFETLSLEGIQVSKPTFRLVAGLEDSSHRSLDASEANLALGMDVLRHLHFYIAYKEQRLYITSR